MRFLDFRIFWTIRFLLYKFFFSKALGIGYLGKPSFVKGIGRIKIGKNFGLFPGWRIELINQAKLTIGDNVRIGNNLFINCGSSIEIGDNVTMSANIFIGTTDLEISNDLNDGFSAWKNIERPIVIEKNCFIGYGAVLLPGTHLGQGCVVGANTVVRGSYIPGQIISSSKGKIIKSR